MSRLPGRRLAPPTGRRTRTAVPRRVWCESSGQVGDPFRIEPCTRDRRVPPPYVTVGHGPRSRPQPGGNYGRQQLNDLPRVGLVHRDDQPLNYLFGSFQHLGGAIDEHRRRRCRRRRGSDRIIVPVCLPITRRAEQDCHASDNDHRRHQQNGPAWGPSCSRLVNRDDNKIVTTLSRIWHWPIVNPGTAVSSGIGPQASSTGCSVSCRYSSRALRCPLAPEPNAPPLRTFFAVLSSRSSSS